MTCQLSITPLSTDGNQLRWEAVPEIRKSFRAGWMTSSPVLLEWLLQHQTTGFFGLLNGTVWSLLTHFLRLDPGQQSVHRSLA